MKPGTVSGGGGFLPGAMNCGGHVQMTDFDLPVRRDAAVYRHLRGALGRLFRRRDPT